MKILFRLLVVPYLGHQIVFSKKNSQNICEINPRNNSFWSFAEISWKFCSGCWLSRTWDNKSSYLKKLAKNSWNKSAKLFFLEFSEISWKFWSGCYLSPTCMGQRRPSNCLILKNSKKCEHSLNKSAKLFFLEFCRNLVRSLFRLLQRPSNRLILKNSKNANIR